MEIPACIALCRITDFKTVWYFKATVKDFEEKAKAEAEAMNAKIKEQKNEIDNLKLELEDKYNEIDKLKLEYETVRASGMQEAW
jgi:hypothetical protein